MRLFAGCVGLIGLHTVTDAFLAPEPGTHWDDHLLAGVASLAILGTAVWLYPRLPDGGRAVVAIALSQWLPSP